MATLITVGNSEGSRRCDAHCHEAKEPECTCICGGRYHGRGEEAARDQLHEDLLEGRLGEELAQVARQLQKHGIQETLF